MKKYLIYMVFIIICPNKSAYPSFTENKGQIRDQYYQLRPDVLFSGSANGLYYHLKKNGLHYQLFRVESWKKEENRKLHLQPQERIEVPDKIGIYRVDVNWLNTSPETKIIREKALPGYTNYYNVPNGMEPALFVKSYEGVLYQNIYKGIDLHFYHIDGSLEYDFLVHPHADYRQIQIQIKGATLKVSEKKELIIQTPFGDIVEGALKVFQDEKQISAEWVVRDDVVSFHIPKYDKTKPLRIDPPVRVWGTYYGGYGTVPSTLGNDVAKSCITDTSGNIIIGGNTSSDSPLHIATTGAHQTTYQGFWDVFIAKFNGSGTRLWGTYYGGINDDYCYSISADRSGNVYFTGETNSPQGISTVGAFQQNLSSYHTDAYLAKFSANGVLVWATYFGGGFEYDIGTACVADREGNVYLAGFFSGDSSLTTPGAYRRTGPGPLLAKFNAAGARLWATYFDRVYASAPGVYHSSWPNALALDQWNNAYVAGNTNSDSLNATSTAHQSVRGGDVDVFLVKFDSSGTRLWCTYYGGLFADRGYGCAVDSAGYVYLAGATISNNGIATAGAFQDVLSGQYNDAFLAKFDGSTGNRVWGTYYGGSESDEANACTTGKHGKVYLCGYTRSTQQIATSDGHQPNHGGGYRDAFIAEFDSSGQRLWSTYYGGSSDETGWACTASPNGYFYMAGVTNSHNGIATPGAHQESRPPGGLLDAFLVKFDYCVPSPVNATGNSPLCAGEDIQLTADSVPGASYHWNGPGGFYSDQRNPVLANATPDQSGSYTLTLTNQNGCPSYATVTITVNLLPSDSVYMINNTLWAHHSGAQYQWIDCNTNQPIVGATAPSFTPTQTGNYAVIVTTPAGCTDTSACTNVTIVGVDEIVELKEWKIYPNPSSDAFTILADQSGGFELYDITGKRIDQFHVQENEPFIYRHTFPQGVYVLRSKEGGVMRRIIVH